MNSDLVVCVSLHDNEAFMKTSLDGKIELYNTLRRDWIKNPVYEGTLLELTKKLCSFDQLARNNEALHKKLECLENDKDYLQGEIDRLLDNQIGTPYR